MWKKIVAGTAMLFALACAAAVDVNKASEAELTGVKGVGPALSKRILDARAEGAFKDWPDFMGRVKGVKDKSASKLSEAGLTIDGRAYGAPPAAVAKTEPPAKKTAAPAAPAVAPKTPAKP